MTNYNSCLLQVFMRRAGNVEYRSALLLKHSLASSISRSISINNSSSKFLNGIMSIDESDGDGNGKSIWRFGAFTDSSEFGWKSLGVINYYSRYRCLLCDHEKGVSMDSNEKGTHSTTQHHKMRVRKLKLMQEVRIEQLLKLDEVKHDLQRLRVVPVSIKTLLAEWFITEGKVSTKYTPENSIKEMKRLCEMYQTQEPLVQLELALWRNACLLNPPNNIDPVNYFVRGGWKEHKAALRHNQMISIVITNVLPFLDMQ